MRDLEAAGRCVRFSANRIKIAPGLLETPQYEAECEERWRNLRAYLVEFREIGFDYDLFSHVGAQSPVKAPTRSRTVAALIDDFLLRLGEGPTRMGEDFLNGVIIAALMNMNGAPVRRDRELTWKYAAEDTPPPDSLREPVTIAMLSRRLALSEDVIGRRLNLYVQGGHAQRVRGGYLFVMAQQLTPEVQLSRKAVNERFFRLVQALRQMGIDPATVSLD